MPKRLRIFLSSPGDVAEERLRAHLVIQKLARDYARFFRVEPYLWEHEPMLASGHFQDAIEPPSACDVVVLILYARLGTSLPERTGLREYRGIDGRVPVTGTEWEFEEALQAHRSRGAPDLLAYRRIGDPSASLADPLRRAEQEQQWEALQAFWRRHFETGGIFLAGSAQFRTLEEFDRKLEAHLIALIEKRIADGLAADATEAPHWLRGSPFRSLAAYDFDDAPVFFGRDAQTRTALTRLQAAAETGCAFLLVLGASGAGKSSLARAGILPGLFGPKAVPGVGVWRRVVLRPGDGPDPVVGLANALAAGDPAGGVGLPEILSAGLGAEALAAHLAAAPDDPSFPFRVALQRVADAARQNGLLPHETARLVILVDQLEELFMQGADPARRDLFLRILAGLARSGVVWVVPTMRNDLWHHVAGSPVLLDLVESGARLDLVQPDGSEIIEIIRRPAKAAGLAFEVAPETGVGLDAVMATAAAEEPGALPLLSVMLDTLYERDVKAAADGRDRHTLTFATYRALGELRGAIAQRADAALRALERSDPDAAAALPSVLRALVTAAAGDRIGSRPARLDAFPDGSPEARLVRAFLAPEARLFVSSGAEDGSEVRLAHEALLENWPTARDQIVRDRRDLETRARLEALERRWANADDAQKRETLLTGLNLAEGTDLARRWRLDRAAGLGLFVAMSERADRMRRNRLGVAAAALVLLFAGVASVAGLQWSRAEEQASAASLAAEAERDARAVAERQRERADQERARALDNERRTAEALRGTKREMARTLATQAELAAGQHDVRRSLTLAVQAGRLERGLVAPDEPAASEPALLQATADVREVLQVLGSPKAWAVPFDFFGGRMLAYADGGAGLVLADLASPPRVAMRASLPQGQVPRQVRALPAAGLVAAAAGPHLVLVEAGDGRVAADLVLPAQITSLDAHEPTGLIAAAAGTAVALVRIGEPAEPDIVPVPNARTGTNVGQVRFDASGRTLYVSYGVEVLALDVEARRFAEVPVTELDAGGAGIGRELLQSLLEGGRGLVSIVDMAPDRTGTRILFKDELELKSFDPATRATRILDRGGSDQLILGLGFTDQGRTGALKEAVAILGRRGNTDLEFRLKYIMDDGALPPFESFSVRADDVNGEKVRSCRVSLDVSHLACQFWGETHQRIAVWRLLGGSHRFERLFIGAETSGVLAGPGPGPDLILGSDEAITAVRGGQQTQLATVPAGWHLTDLNGPFLVAASSSQVRIWRRTRDSLDPVLGPLDARAASVDAVNGRVVLNEGDRVSAYDLAGQRLWTVPGLADLRTASVSADGRRAAAVTGEAVYLFDAASGRLSASVPIAPGEEPAVDPGAMAVAFADRDGVAHLLDLDSRESRPLGGCKPSRLAWNPAGDTVLVGCRTGAVMAFDRAGFPRWTIPSPLGQAYSEQESWPGQPPKGLVLQLAFSPDGQRLAVVRQDLPAVDLHDASRGGYLTRLTPPWSSGVPARVALGPDGAVLTSWAVHAMARAKPRQVTLHRLPDGLDAALAAAEARLSALDALWSPEGPPAPQPESLH